jgi:hypothetical protein
MTFLSEDPTNLVVILALVAVSLLVALRVTQQAKYLFWAIGTLVMLAAVLLIEHFWVTDNERVERVVYDLRNAVLASDVEEVLAHLTPDVEYVQEGVMVLNGESTRALIRANLENSSFDFIHIRDLQTSAGRQTRRGKAEFRIYAKGTLRTALATLNIGTANSTWSLGFQETEPKVWKVNRITPVAVPEGAIVMPSRTAQSRAPGRPGRGETRQGTPPLSAPVRSAPSTGARFRSNSGLPPAATSRPGNNAEREGDR